MKKSIEFIRILKYLSVTTLKMVFFEKSGVPHFSKTGGKENAKTGQFSFHLRNLEKKSNQGSLRTLSLRVQALVTYFLDRPWIRAGSPVSESLHTSVVPVTGECLRHRSCDGEKNLIFSILLNRNIVRTSPSVVRRGSSVFLVLFRPEDAATPRILLFAPSRTETAASVFGPFVIRDLQSKCRL